MNTTPMNTTQYPENVEWATLCARTFLSAGENSGTLAEMLRQNYTPEGIGLVANALIEMVGVNATSGDARIKGFSTSVSRACPRVVGADGKPSKEFACAQLAVSFKSMKRHARGSGSVSKVLTARVVEKETADRDAGKEACTHAVSALMSAWAAGAKDDCIGALRNGVAALAHALGNGTLRTRMGEEASMNMLVKLELALEATELGSEAESE